MLRRLVTNSKDIQRNWCFRMLTSSFTKMVKLNLEKNGIPYHEWETTQMEEFAMKLSKIE